MALCYERSSEYFVPIKCGQFLFLDEELLAVQELIVSRGYFFNEIHPQVKKYSNGSAWKCLVYKIEDFRPF